MIEAELQLLLLGSAIPWMSCNLRPYDSCLCSSGLLVISLPMLSLFQGGFPGMLPGVMPPAAMAMGMMGQQQQQQMPQQLQMMHQLASAAAAGGLPGTPAAAARPPKGPTTRILVMSDMVQEEELKDDEEYADILGDIRTECARFGEVKDVVIPRPAEQPVPGLGKVFVEFSTVEQAVAACADLETKEFGGRPVLCDYLPEEKWSQRILE